jgi:hypothetical protein
MKTGELQFKASLGRIYLSSEKSNVVVVDICNPSYARDINRSIVV